MYLCMIDEAVQINEYDMVKIHDDRMIYIHTYIHI
jgi:hypothetical protein